MELNDKVIVSLGREVKDGIHIEHKVKHDDHICRIVSII